MKFALLTLLLLIFVSLFLSTACRKTDGSEPTFARVSDVNKILFFEERIDKVGINSYNDMFMSFVYKGLD